MKRYACVSAVAILLFVNVPSGRGQQYFYTPSTLAPDEKTQGKDGILVQEVAVQKGDSLYKISLRFSGHGMYFPQILLFNDIKNPNKIYPGNVFKIPVSRNTVPEQTEKILKKHVKAAEAGRAASPNLAATATNKQEASSALQAASLTEISMQELKKVDVSREKKRGTKDNVVGPAKKQVSNEKQHAVLVGADNSTTGQKLFERAVKAYRQDDCRTALELFDKFLAENQVSPLAADASLYKAECYLKQSTQN